jgi:hypothetical protein
MVGGTTPPAAVVVDQEAMVRDTPSADGGERHRLPPGSEVWILRSVGDFHLLVDGRGRRGWVPINTVLGL